MSALYGTHEIVELTESYDSESKVRGKSLKKHSIEDDINKIFEAIESASSRKSERNVGDVLYKSAMKRPMRVSPSHASGIGFSEPVSLKQALRGLCISQASEMAAVKKRILRPSASPGISEVGAAKKLYRAVVIEASQSSQLLDESNGNLMEISFVPERSSPESGNVSVAEVSEKKGKSSVLSEDISPVPTNGGRELPISDSVKKHVGKLKSASLSSNYLKTGQVRNPKEGLSFCEQNSRPQNIAKKKIVPKIVFATKNHSHRSEGPKNDQPSKIAHQTPESLLEKGCEELKKSSPSNSLDSNASKAKNVVMKADEKLRYEGKGEFSQSSKSSIGEYSTTTSYSDESYLSGSSRSGYRPRMSKDLRWEAISSVQKQHGKLGMAHFKILRKIGGGDIGTVYLSELNGSSCLFALKVMDNEFLSSRKKMQRAQTEKEILEILDHPFLPTLYAHFTTNKYSCVVMEYCPGGDLHVLRQKQITRNFPEKAAR